MHMKHNGVNRSREAAYPAASSFAVQHSPQVKTQRLDVGLQIPRPQSADAAGVNYVDTQG